MALFSVLGGVRLDPDITRLPSPHWSGAGSLQVRLNLAELWHVLAKEECTEGVREEDAVDLGEVVEEVEEGVAEGGELGAAEVPVVLRQLETGVHCGGMDQLQGVLQVAELAEAPAAG